MTDHSPETVAHFFKNAGAHCAHIMTAETGKTWRGSAHPDMPIVEVEISETRTSEAAGPVWDRCVVKIDGREIDRGNRHAAINAYMAEFAKAVGAI